MDKLDELFNNPLKFSVLDKGTPFAANLKVLIQSRMGEEKNCDLPYRLKRMGGQYLGLENEGNNYRRYEEMAVYGKGCNWNCINAPSSAYDYAYSNEFDYTVDYFSMVSQFYLGMVENEEFPFEKMINGTHKDREDFLGVIDFVSCGDSIRDELLEHMGISNLKDTDDIASMALILSTAYVHYDINGIEFPKEWKELLSKTYRQMFLLRLEMYEDTELSIPLDIPKLEQEYENMREGYIIEYLDYFMDYLKRYLFKESKSTYVSMIPMLMSVLFCYHINEEGTPVAFYMYSSKELKEYTDLKEKYPGSSYVDRMDKMLPLLMDPAGKKETAYGGFYVPFGDEELEGAVTMEYGFYDEEYVCCYMYYADMELVIPKVFPMMMSYFHHLLDEFKKEVENYEGSMVKTA